MLKINLLPGSARTSSLSPMEQVSRAPIVKIAVGGLVGFALLLWVPGMLYTKQVKSLHAQIGILKPHKASMDQLKTATDRLRVEEAILQGLYEGSARRWAQRLNGLSDRTPDGTWYTEFALETSRSLVIQGAAIGGLANIGGLVDALESEPMLAEVLRDIEIESIKRVQDGEIEIVKFTLTGDLTRGARGQE